MEPMLLTPELLEKSGFRLIDNIFLGEKNPKIKYINISPYYHKTIGIDSHIWVLKQTMAVKIFVEDASLSIPHIKYIHQLQDLHFVLTGTELKINL